MDAKEYFSHPKIEFGDVRFSEHFAHRVVINGYNDILMAHELAHMLCADFMIALPNWGLSDPLTSNRPKESGKALNEFKYRVLTVHRALAAKFGLSVFDNMFVRLTGRRIDNRWKRVDIDALWENAKRRLEEWG